MSLVWKSASAGRWKRAGGAVTIQESASTTTWLAPPTVRAAATTVEAERVRSPRPVLEGVLRPFDSPDEARAAVRALRRALLPYVPDATAMVDALLLIICAKGLDETEGTELRFAMQKDMKVYRTARRFDEGIGRARQWLSQVSHEPSWPYLAIPRETAVDCVKALGPRSILLTAAGPDGSEILRAFFAEVVGEAGSMPEDSMFRRSEPATQLLDKTAFKTRSSRLRTIVVAAAKEMDGLARLKERNLEWMRGNYKKGVFQLTNFPKLIHVELSTHCNLRCRTCSITRPGRQRELTYLSLETLERLRPALPFITDCKLHGGGEPFMHPQIERVLQVFRDEGVRLNTVTNAVLIRERLGRLIGETFSSLTISVDGGTKETYEYVRLRASWEKLLRGIDNVNTYRNPDLRLIIGVVMLKCNIHQLPDLVRFAHEHNAQELQAAWLVPFHDLPWTQSQELTDDPVRTNRYMDEARALGDELGVSVRIPDNLPDPDGDHIDAIEMLGAHPAERGADRAGEEASTIVALDHEATYWDLHGTNKVEGHCRLMYDRAMILVDGNVKPCGQSRYVPELGSIHDRSFEQCWNGDGYQNLRSTFNGGTLPRTCQSCNFIRSKQLGTARLVY
jgi:radical SAM protein with 4Fe4S-binding SPASM domain